MQERLRDAIAAFYQDKGRLPAGVVVHQSILASEVEEARLAVKALELNLVIRGNAGPLCGEVWLQVSNSSEKPVLRQTQFELEV